MSNKYRYITEKTSVKTSRVYIDAKTAEKMSTISAWQNIILGAIGLTGVPQGIMSFAYGIGSELYDIKGPGTIITKTYYEKNTESIC